MVVLRINLQTFEATAHHHTHMECTEWTRLDIWMANSLQRLNRPEQCCPLELTETFGRFYYSPAPGVHFFRQLHQLDSIF